MTGLMSIVARWRQQTRQEAEHHVWELILMDAEYRQRQRFLRRLDAHEARVAAQFESEGVAYPWHVTRSLSNPKEDS